MAPDALEPPAAAKSGATSPTGAAGGTFEDDEPWGEVGAGIETAYFLRLAATTAKGTKHWDTRKIYLYDSKFRCEKKTVEVTI